MRRGIAGAVIAALCMLSGCATMETAPGGPRAVAVWDLEDLSPGDAGRPDLGQLLSGEIIDALRQARVVVVERERLVSILEELNIGSSSLADEETRLRVGRVIGAGEMVFGGYMVVGATMRIDLRRVDVETGRVTKTAKGTSAAGDLAGWLLAARTSAVELFP